MPGTNDRHDQRPTHDPQPDRGKDAEHRPPHVPPEEPPGRVTRPRPSHGAPQGLPTR